MGITLHDTHAHSHGSHGHSHSEASDNSDSSDTEVSTSNQDTRTYGTLPPAHDTSNQTPVTANRDTVVPMDNGSTHNGYDTQQLIPRESKKEKSKKSSKQNMNVRAAFIHVIGDLLQSIGVLIAAFIIYYKVS